MKQNFIFIFLLLVVTLNVSAQTDKGTKMAVISISGSMKRTPSKFYIFDYGLANDLNKQLDFQTDLRIGYFIANKICIGLNPQITLSKNQKQNSFLSTDSLKRMNQQTTIARNTLFSLNPFIRFYPIRFKQLGVFVEGSAGIAFCNSTTSDELVYIQHINKYPLYKDKSNVSENVFNYKIGIGINYFISKKAALEASFLYQEYKLKKLEVANGLYVQNTSLYLGFNYLF